MIGVIIPELVERHLADAGFRWWQRCTLERTWSWRPEALERFDTAVDANLDGLRISGDSGWELVKRCWADAPSPDTAFACAVLAAERNDAAMLGVLAGIDDPMVRTSLLAGFGWIAPDIAENAAKCLLPSHPGVAWMGMAMHGRRHPGLTAGLMADDRLVRIPAIQAIIRLGAGDEIGLCRRGLTADDVGIRFHAAQALALGSGDPAALDVLRWFTSARSSYRIQAALTVACCGCADPAWIDSLWRQTGCQRVALLAAGAGGDVGMIPWLDQRLDEPIWSRLAVSMIGLITGMDVEDDGLDGQCPSNFNPPEPSDDPADDNVEGDIDAALPWPDKERFRRQLGDWRPPGDQARLLLGRPWTPEAFAAVWRTGRQFQRHVAALHMARGGGGLSDPLVPFRRQAR